MLAYVYINFASVLSSCYLVWSVRHTSTHASAADSDFYGVVIDAGSTGSRVRIFGWPTRRDRYELPSITEIYTHKVQPGITEFVGSTQKLGNYTFELLKRAKDNVPQKKHSSTSFYFMATAGMRLLLEEKANAVIDALDRFFSNSTINPFRYKSINTRILSGEEEGVFSWITVNYLRQFFNQPTTMSSAGIVELGGASTQIAFMPDVSILADKFPVKIAGIIYPVYVHSYLYYGQSYVDHWVQEDIHRRNTSLTEFDNPCFPKGYNNHVLFGSKNVTFKGQSNPEACSAILDNLIYKVEESRCYPKPCAIGPVYQPTIDSSMPFAAVSAFIFTLKTLNVLDGEGKFSSSEIEEAAHRFLSKDLATMQNETGRTDIFVQLEALLGIFIPKLFTRGYGFDPASRQISAMAKINSRSTDWPLGAIIYENERIDWECPDIPGAIIGRAATRNTGLWIYVIPVLLCLALSLARSLPFTHTAL